MRQSILSRYRLSACAILVALAGCGWSMPIEAPGSAPLGSNSIAPGAAHAQSWMSPHAAAQNLLYVTDDENNSVLVYSYLPAQPKLVGKLAGIPAPEGECVDSAGDVWIATMNNVVEYAHGGTKPIAKVELTGNLPVNCAVDPKSGNLAVTYGWIPYCYSGNSYANCQFTYLAVYAGAHGKPVLHRSARKWHFDYCSYDNLGDLFVSSYFYDGSSSVPNFHFGEVLAGSNKLVNLTVDPPLNPFGQVDGIQFHSGYLAIALPDFSSSIIDRFAVSGRTAKRVAATTLENSGYVRQFWIEGNTVVAGNDLLAGGVRYYGYPAGGPPKLHIPGVKFPFGVAVSLKK